MCSESRMSRLNEEWLEGGDEERRDERQNPGWCGLCGMTLSSSSILARHVRLRHKEEMLRGPESIICPKCDARLTSYAQLDQHLADIHHIAVEVEELSFRSFEEFVKWKTRLEVNQMGQFTKKAKAPTKSRSYYYCRHFGMSKRQWKSKYLWQKSIETGKTCPARIGLIGVKEGFKVQFHKTHVGHCQQVKHQKLSDVERAVVAERIREGVPLDQILSDARRKAKSSVANSRWHLEERDLRDIIRDFNLESITNTNNTVRSGNYVLDLENDVSVEFLLEQWNALGDEDPVVFYKEHGKLYPTCSLQEEDFMIVFMTQYQREALSTLATKKILVDSVRGLSGHVYLLTALVVVDERGAGCCVAFCLSNRTDTVAMKKFFEAVRKRVGVIPADVFVSDDAPSLIDAWSRVMGRPRVHLLCTWYIDKNWRTTIQTKVGSNMKQEVYGMCRALLQTTDKGEFGLRLQSFLETCMANPKSESFGRYFQSNYANQPELWALCYRHCLEPNTDKYLEETHKKLTDCCATGKENRRMSECIGLLLQLAKKSALERIVHHTKGKQRDWTEQITDSHKCSATITDAMVCVVSPNTWMVQSLTAGTGLYIVRTISTNCEGCPVSCVECGICIHQFECTCTDNMLCAKFCKHIHACIRFRNLNLRQLKENYDGEVIQIGENVCQMVEQVVNTDDVEEMADNICEVEQIDGNCEVEQIGETMCEVEQLGESVCKNSCEVEQCRNKDYETKVNENAGSRGVGECSDSENLHKMLDAVRSLADRIPEHHMPRLVKGAELLVQLAEKLSQKGK